jgi:kynurenine formamidase
MTELDAQALEASNALIESYVQRCSNWGRWGVEDRAGTLNLITAEVRLAGLAAARSGESVSLARPIISGAPGPGGMSNLHFMRKTGNEVSGVGSASFSDWMSLCIHGPNTHLDAFSHFSWNGKLYNGRSVADSITGAGAAEGDVVVARNGIVTRGVLIDLEVLGDDAPASGSALTPEILDRCCALEGVEVGRGDALLIKTGTDSYERQWTGRDTKTGLDLSATPWLFERENALLGSDRDSDVRPGILAGVGAPVHTVALVSMGLWMLDNAFLGTLAERCRALGRYDFAFVLAPLLVDQATGSPVNPIAVL